MSGLDPLGDIENSHAWKDMGKGSIMFIRGAMEEGATSEEALSALQAFFGGILSSKKEDESDEDED